MFKKKFSPEIFSIEENYQVSIKNPFLATFDYATYRDTFKQKYKIDINYDVENGFECVRVDNECLKPNNTHFQTGMETSLGNLGEKSFTFERNFFSQEEYEKWSNKRFTGMNVSWHCINCSGPINTNANFKSFPENRLLVKIANAIHDGQTSSEELWKAINKAKSEWFSLQSSDYESIFQDVLNKGSFLKNNMMKHVSYLICIH